MIREIEDSNEKDENKSNIQFLLGSIPLIRAYFRFITVGMERNFAIGTNMWSKQILR